MQPHGFSFFAVRIGVNAHNCFFQVDMVQAILDPDYFVNALTLCRDNLARLQSTPDLLVGLGPASVTREMP